MDKTVARLNIEHYRDRIARENDESLRQHLLRQLAEEESKLDNAILKEHDRLRRVI